MSITRNRQLVRALSLYRMFEAGEWLTLRQMAIRTKASERTARRDIDALRAAGCHIVTVVSEGETTRWRMHRS